MYLPTEHKFESKSIRHKSYNHRKSGHENGIFSENDPCAKPRDDNFKIIFNSNLPDPLNFVPFGMMRYQILP